MNRKDDHIKYALDKNNLNYNCFDDMKLLSDSLPQYNIDEIDISTTLAQITLNTPFFINAMTGGSEQGKIINNRLSYIAEKCDLMMATGSYSAAIKDTTLQDSFPLGNVKLKCTNIGADKPYSFVEKAINSINPTFMQIHLNVMQELIMEEGDHNFKEWKLNLQKTINNVTTPLIVKEVGFGMNKKTIHELIEMGVKIIDISGKGGTNFAYIENMRKTAPLTYLNEWGIPTLIALLESKQYQSQCEIIASGGIRNALDIVKCFVLGAKAVGMSGYFLHLLQHYDNDSIIDIVNQLKLEIKKIMIALNCKTIKELQNVDYYLINEAYYYSKKEN